MTQRRHWRKTSQRYLSGDPIQARRTSWMYRLQKKARKHKALVAVGSTASVLLLVMAIYGCSAKSGSIQREKKRRGRFGQQIKEIESLMRDFASCSAAQHVAGKEDAFDRQWPRSNRKMQRERAEGPAHYALGKGHLVLRDFEAAQRELQYAV